MHSNGFFVLRSLMLVAMLGGVLSLPASAASVVEISDPRIVRALLPMNKSEARQLLLKLKKAGLSARWRSELYPYARTHTRGNSEPIELPTRSGGMCLAMGLKYDVDRVMEMVPQKDAQTRSAVADFLLTHEALHCASFVLPALDARRSQSRREETALEGLALMREEALADQAATQAMLTRGRAGYNAAMGWRRDRLFRFLGGDLDHWSTPLLSNGLDSVSESDYQGMTKAWPKLVKSLTRAVDGSDEQAVAWNAAIHEMPLSVRAGLPDLTEIRAISQELWPDAADWRCAARIKRCDAMKSNEK